MKLFKKSYIIIEKENIRKHEAEKRIGSLDKADAIKLAKAWNENVPTKVDRFIWLFESEKGYIEFRRTIWDGEKK